MEEILKQIDDKLSGGTSYEGLQFLQSFVARKKKAMGLNKTSQCVFHGARRLIERDSSGDAGVLLVWFIESDDLFHLGVGTKGLTADEAAYCDLERILAIVKGLSPEQSVAVVDQIYGPLHQVVAKAGLGRGTPTMSVAAADISSRMEELERLSANTFQATKKWHSAYKVVIRLGELKRAAGILNSWAAEGYINEKPMYFGRAVMQLLADRKLPQAEELIKHCTPFVEDNVSPPVPGGGASGPLAVWHLSIILSGLASMPQQPRVDKQRLFNTLKERYFNILQFTDPRLIETLNKIGAFVFAVALPAEMQGPNPMEMLQQMMMASGGMHNAMQQAPSSSGRGQPPIDMAEILKTLNRLESANKK